MNYKLIFLIALAIHSFIIPMSRTSEEYQVIASNISQLDAQSIGQLTKKTQEIYKILSQPKYARQKNELSFFDIDTSPCLITQVLSAPTKEELLYILCHRGDSSLVKTILNRDPQLASSCIPNIKSTLGNKPIPVFPIYMAIRKGHLKIVQLLWKKGAYKLNNSHLNPLTVACVNDRYSIAKYLLDHDCNTEHKARGASYTPLIHAILCNEDFVQLLLDHGAKVNTIQQGETPLHIAVKNNKPKSTKKLLKAGADIYAERTLDDKTPLDLATHPKIIKLINKHEVKLEKLKKRPGKNKKGE